MKNVRCQKNKRSTFAYIVLHYQTLTETQKCIDSILPLIEESDIIVIIDNASPNGSGRLLLEKYADVSYIKVILNQENLGFSQGNNKGFWSAKYDFHADFIIMMNNDTMILQKNFKNIVMSEYEKERFAVAGPKILNKNFENSKVNPRAPEHQTEKTIIIGQTTNYIKWFLSYLSLDIAFEYIVEKFLGFFRNTEKEYNKKIRNVQLSGCFLIFSKLYITMFDGLNPETYMYLEEPILYARLRKSGLSSIYLPMLEIVHLEDVATMNVFNGKKVQARRFKYKCQMNSYRVLKNEIIEDNR